MPDLSSSLSAEIRGEGRLYKDKGGKSDSHLALKPVESLFDSQRAKSVIKEWGPLLRAECRNSHKQLVPEKAVKIASFWMVSSLPRSSQKSYEE